MKPRAGSLNGIANASHICCAMGCARPIHPKLFMCTAHFRMLSPELRKQYNWHAGHTGQEQKFTELKLACVRAVAEKEGLLEKADHRIIGDANALKADSANAANPNPSTTAEKSAQHKSIMAADSNPTCLCTHSLAAHEHKYGKCMFHDCTCTRFTEVQPKKEGKDS